MQEDEFHQAVKNPFFEKKKKKKEERKKKNLRYNNTWQASDRIYMYSMCP